VPDENGFADPEFLQNLVYHIGLVFHRVDVTQAFGFSVPK
jgi:hypothetical protein